MATPIGCEAYGSGTSFSTANDAVSTIESGVRVAVQHPELAVWRERQRRWDRAIPATSPSLVRPAASITLMLSLS